MFKRKPPLPPACLIVAINPGSIWFRNRELFEGFAAMGRTNCVEPGHDIFEGIMIEGPAKGQHYYIYDCEVEAMTKHHQVTCRCDKYPFPHRAYGGKCDGWELEHMALASGKCYDCEHWREEFQSHPYGMGSASEDISYCDLMANKPNVVFLEVCPAVESRRT